MGFFSKIKKYYICKNCTVGHVNFFKEIEMLLKYDFQKFNNIKGPRKT